MIQKINNIVGHPHFTDYVIYCIGLIVFGILMIGLGPLIPYLSQKQNRPQTDYSVYFLARAIGFIAGALSVKITQKYFSFHFLLATGYLFGGVFSIAANVTQYRSFCIPYFFFASMGFCYIDLFASIATINSFKGQNLDKWLQFLHGCFGIGGLLGPIIIYFWEFQAYNRIGTLIIILSIILYRRKSPQTEIPVSQRYSLIDNDALSEALSKKNKKGPTISMQSTTILCLSFLVLIGQEASYGSWIPSYSVLQGFSTKQHATSYGSYYWFSITFFRFAFLFLPGKIYQKIYGLVSLGVLCPIISLLLINYVNPEFGMIFASIIFGMANSALFPLLLSLPHEYGYIVDPNQNSYFMLSGALGQGSVSVGVGYFMKVFGPSMLFWTMGLLNLIGLINHHQLCKNFSEEKKDQAKQLIDFERNSD